MSVILEDDQKFQDIFGALLARNGQEDVRWFFNEAEAILFAVRLMASAISLDLFKA